MKNAKILEKFKDECNSLQPQEYTGLQSKMYSLKLPIGHIKITAKGVSRSHVLKNLKDKIVSTPSKQQYRHMLHSEQ